MKATIKINTAREKSDVQREEKLMRLFLIRSFILMPFKRHRYRFMR